MKFGNRPLTPRILITGASGTIGSAIARTLASSNCRLILHGYRGIERLNKLADHLRKDGCVVSTITANLAREEDAAPVLHDLTRTEPIDILINNAGTDHYGLAQKTTYDEWKSLFATNVDSAYFCTKACLPHMISQRWGRIVNIASMWGIVGASNESLYAATKGALIAYGKSLAKELSYSGINVNIIAPGAVESAMTDHLSPTDKAALLEEIPMGRLIHPSEIGETVRFLIETTGDAYTGQIFQPNCGMVIQ